MGTRFVVLILIIGVCSALNAQVTLLPLAQLVYPEDGYYGGQFSFYNSHFRPDRGADISGDGLYDYLRSVVRYDDYQNCIAAYWGDPNFTGIPNEVYPLGAYGLSYVQPSWYGDLNGDDRNDLLVTCWSGNSVYTRVTLQGDQFSVEPTTTFSFNYPGGYRAWNGGMDFNNDGYDDIICCDYDTSSDYMGRVDIIYGGDPLDTTVDVHFEGNGDYPRLGRYDAIADLNGDGIVDLIAAFQHGEANSPIYFNIYLGGEDFDNEPEMTFHPEGMNNYESCLAANGDLNGDGCDDIVYTMLNTVYVYWGNESLAMEYSTFSIVNTDSSLPYSYFFFCNINNDKYDDLGLRRYYEDTVDFYLGNQFVPDGVACSVDVAYHCAHEGMGQDLGDINGDGCDDVLVTNGGNQTYATVYTLEGEFSPDSVMIEIGSAFATPGETVEIPITGRFPGSAGARSLSLQINGFADFANVVDVSFDGSILANGGWQCNWGNLSQSVSIYCDGEAPFAGQGLIATMSIEIDEGIDIGSIPLNASSCMINGGAVPVRVQNGSIMIGTTAGYGDVDMNEHVQGTDVTMLLQYLVGECDLSAVQKYVSDVTLDGTCSALDAALIMRYLMGYLDELPCPPASPGDYYGSGDVYGDNINQYGNADVFVPFHFSNLENILGFSWTYTFDETKLSLQGIDFNNDNIDVAMCMSVANGTIHVAGYSIEPIDIEQFDLLLQFDCITANDGYTSVVLDELRWNEESVEEDVATVAIALHPSGSQTGMMPEVTGIVGCYPNPFNPRTTVSFYLAEPEQATLQVFNTKGQLIRTLLNKRMPSGSHQVEWDGTDSTGKSTASGVYLFRFKACAVQDIQKALLLQ